MSIFSSNGDKLVCNACFCCNSLISSDLGKVIGCSCLNECFCIKNEFCLKVGEKPMECLLGKPVIVELMLCKVGCACCSCGVKKPKLFVAGKSEVCCLSTNCALPPDGDTPSLLALFGLLCYPKQGCCKKFSDAKWGNYDSTMFP